MQAVHLTTPFSDAAIQRLRAGDWVSLSGVVYTGRDAAHKRMTELLDGGKPLPFDPRGQAIYYTGPCPAPPGRAVGSAGPTTSLRMDAYAPRLMREGLRVMIGKGERSEAVVRAIRQYAGIYLSAVGGTGALTALRVEQAEVVAFDDLGPEAIYRLTVRELPLMVAIDCKGESIWTTRRSR
ncbi:MAG: FumA C-terminus/TtdB family hydratase beta subunit [Oscillospiraceae bacterium]|nr:FumA C-terminus/TtdB family hydratase beta subunit [Oscillospiraceae bacterium]